MIRNYLAIARETSGNTFLDDHFEQLYRSDQQMSAVVTVMAALAILFSCMGLFGSRQ